MELEGQQGGRPGAGGVASVTRLPVAADAPTTSYGHRPFVGTHRVRLEANGRFSLPTALRHAFGELAVVRPYRDLHLNVWTPAAFAAVDAAVKASRPVEPRTRRRVHQSALEIPFDKQYRMILPEAARERVGIGEEIVLAGAMETIEIWAVDRWEREVAVDDGDLFFDGFEGL